MSKRPATGRRIKGERRPPLRARKKLAANSPRRRSASRSDGGLGSREQNSRVFSVITPVRLDTASLQQPKIRRRMIDEITYSGLRMPWSGSRSARLIRRDLGAGWMIEEHPNNRRETPEGLGRGREKLVVRSREGGVMWRRPRLIDIPIKRKARSRQEEADAMRIARQRLAASSTAD